MLVTERQNYPEYFRHGMPGYVLRDWEVVDYQCYELGDTGLWFRGPAPERLESGKYFTAIGAAQTFGCFCPRPYPALLEERLGMPALNLGYSGAGPSFFKQHSELLEYVNRSAFCIVQVMSGRSVRNAFLNNTDGLAYGTQGGGTFISAEAAFEELLERHRQRIPFGSRRFKRIWMRLFPAAAPRRFVNESRKQWLRDYESLMHAITVPKVVLWFSERDPFYFANYATRKGVFRKFPQMVNHSMMRKIRQQADHYVRATSTRGMPQPLVSRFTGDPVSVDLAADKPLYEGVIRKNSYYPSPEMQEDAAIALEAVCKGLLATASRRNS